MTHRGTHCPSGQRTLINVYLQSSREGVLHCFSDMEGQSTKNDT